MSYPVLKKRAYIVKVKVKGRIIVKVQAIDKCRAVDLAIRGIEGTGELELLTDLTVTDWLEVKRG